MAHFSIGTASVNWGFDALYTWATTPPFDRMLDEMAATGYEGTEISYHFPTDIPYLAGELRARGLRAASTFHGVDLLDPARHGEEIARVVPVVDRLQALGCDVLIVADAMRPERLAIAGRVADDGSNGLADARWQALGDGLNKIGHMLHERGMRLVVHPHVGTYIETRAEIDRMCALTDPAVVGLCPDTGHLAYAGSDPEAVFADYAARIWYVHLKDIDAELLRRVRSERIDFAGAVHLGTFVPIGMGMVDMDRIFGALRQADYHGWVIVEQDAPPDPLAAAEQSRRFLRDRFGF